MTAGAAVTAAPVVAVGTAGAGVDVSLLQRAPGAETAVMGAAVVMVARVLTVATSTCSTRTLWAAASTVNRNWVLVAPAAAAGTLVRPDPAGSGAATGPQRLRAIPVRRVGLDNRVPLGIRAKCWCSLIRRSLPGC